MDFTALSRFDLSLMSACSSDSLFIDRMMAFLASGWTWVPLFFVLLFCVCHNNKSLRLSALLVIVAVEMVGVIALALFALVEPASACLRPAAAASSFALALFLSLVVRSALLSATLFAWTFCLCLSQLYLALHSPSEMFFGILLGAVIGALSYRLYLYIYNKLSGRMSHISSRLTSTGYSYADVYTVMTVFFATLLAADIYAVAI